MGFQQFLAKMQQVPQKSNLLIFVRATKHHYDVTEANHWGCLYFVV